MNAASRTGTMDSSTRTTTRTTTSTIHRVTNDSEQGRS